MVAGSVTVTAYWSADHHGNNVQLLRAALPHPQWRAIGSKHAVGSLHLTGDEQARRESSHAPANPVTAFVPPGPVVTRATLRPLLTLA